MASEADPGEAVSFVPGKLPQLLAFPWATDITTPIAARKFTCCAIALVPLSSVQPDMLMFAARILNLLMLVPTQSRPCGMNPQLVLAHTFTIMSLAAGATPAQFGAGVPPGLRQVNPGSMFPSAMPATWVPCGTASAGCVDPSAGSAGLVASKPATNFPVNAW